MAEEAWLTILAMVPVFFNPYAQRCFEPEKAARPATTGKRSRAATAVGPTESAHLGGTGNSSKSIMVLAGKEQLSGLDFDPF